MIKKIYDLKYLEDFYDNFEIKNKNVLCLEADYFNVFKFEVENVLNNEDRLSKIEDKLDILFPKYDISKYILNFEIIEKIEENETLLISLLDIEKLNQKNKNIFDNITKLKVISIIPNFLKVREYKENADFYSFDLGENALIISKYINNIIDDVQVFQISPYENTYESQVFYSDIINNYLFNIKENSYILFTGRKIDFNQLNLKDKNYLYFNVEKVNIKKYPNFLPENIKKKYFLYYTNEKYLLSLLILSLITAAALFFLYFNIYNFEEEIAQLEIKKANLENELENLKKENINLETSNIELTKKIQENKEESFEIHKLLDEIFINIPKDLKLLSLEYDNNKIFNIIGESSNPSTINEFLKNLENSEIFSLKNSDYILKKGNKYEFKFEIGYN